MTFNPPGVTWAEIDLDAIAHNVATIKRHVGPSVALMAVVKANAYGHGMLPVAEAVLASGAGWLAVNRVEEGRVLRQAGISARILVMGYIRPSQAAEVVTHRLTPTVTETELAQALSEAARKAHRSLPVHIKVDTGMGRFGLLPDEVLPFAKTMLTSRHLHLEGMYTHFSVAEIEDKSYTWFQFEKYMGVVELLARNGIAIPIRHVANSAAVIDLPEMHLDAVRAGLALYGLLPSKRAASVLPLKPALALKSRVGRVRTLPPGSSISYGRTYITDRPTPVALIPCGYGDGYLRHNSSRASVLIHGQRAPIVGRVCMDQMVVDVTGIEDVALDDEVVLIGSQQGERITAEEVAEWAQTINYEVTTQLLPVWAVFTSEEVKRRHSAILCSWPKLQREVGS